VWKSVKIRSSQGKSRERIPGADWLEFFRTAGLNGGFDLGNDRFLCLFPDENELDFLGKILPFSFGTEKEIIVK
jgi:hypothetical protein